MDRIFCEADFVSLHLPLTPETKGIVTGEKIAMMKPTAYLINTARGPIIDEAALIAALQAKKIAGAGLDVFQVEPLQADNPLLGLDNVVLTPHQGYVTRENYVNFISAAVANVLLAGRHGHQRIAITLAGAPRFML